MIVEYCTVAHATVLKGFLKAPAEIVAAVRNGERLSDAKLDVLANYTGEMVEKASRMRIPNDWRGRNLVPAAWQ